jgi:hypothetical protein
MAVVRSAVSSPGGCPPDGLLTVIPGCLRKRGQRVNGAGQAASRPARLPGGASATRRAAYRRKFFVDAGVLLVGDRGIPGGRPLVPVRFAYWRFARERFAL